MLELIWDLVYTGGAIYAGVWGTRKYFHVGRESPQAVAQRQAQKALTR